MENKELRPCPFCGVKISLADTDAPYGGTEVFIKCECKNFFSSDEEALKWFKSAWCWKEIDRLKKDVNDLIWNLAGCDTLAMGYGIEESFSKELARPALYSVHKMAIANKKLKAQNQRMKEAIKRLKKLNYSPFRKESESIIAEALKEVKE